jgi:hypothetical protein
MQKRMIHWLFAQARSSNKSFQICASLPLPDKLSQAARPQSRIRILDGIRSRDRTWCDQPVLI